MHTDVRLITAAGGNGTVIQILTQPLSRQAYAAVGTELLSKEMENDGAEQAGFLILGGHPPHFRMAGNEFCGNASRSVAVLISEIEARPDVTFTVSGFDGTVSADVGRKSDNLYDVRCEFPGMPVEVRQVVLADGRSGQIVDLGGIVHVVIEGEFPQDDYEAEHRRIMEEFNLQKRGAVGVIWFKQNQEGAVVMHPVVWVRDVDTFYYERSCGSGTIAVGRVTGANEIVQPTGKIIQVEITEDRVVLASEMEEIR